MDIGNHEQNKKRLFQTLNVDLDNATTDMIAVLKKYNLDAMPETAHDFMCYVLETIHLGKMDIHEYKHQTEDRESIREKLENIATDLLDEIRRATLGGVTSPEEIAQLTHAAAVLSQMIRTFHFQ